MIHVLCCVGLEGCAGMAAVSTKNGPLDLGQFYAAVQKALPAYARPVFLRLLHRVDATGQCPLHIEYTRLNIYSPKAGVDVSTNSSLFYSQQKSTYSTKTLSYKFSVLSMLFMQCYLCN